MIENIALFCFAILSISALLCLGRIVAGSSLADRIVALDTLLTVIVIGVAVDAARTGQGVYLDVLLVVSLVAFVGTTAAARLIEKRGSP